MLLEMWYLDLFELCPIVGFLFAYVIFKTYDLFDGIFNNEVVSSDFFTLFCTCMLQGSNDICLYNSRTYLMVFQYNVGIDLIVSQIYHGLNCITFSANQ